MIYIYPKFSRFELFGVRFGGAGLGNLLFMWSRAIVAAEQHNCEVIWPTWPSIKIGPWIRHEKDKRFYGDLFIAKTYSCKSLNKYYTLLSSKKIYVKRYEDANWNSISNNTTVIGIGYGLVHGELQMNFDGLKEYRECICQNIYNNLQPKCQSVLEFRADNAINIHVRLGDFTENAVALKNGANNTQINIEWYVAMVKKLREAAGWNMPINVFSDGTDNEIAQLLVQPDVHRRYFGNSISDIIALSKAPIMIASASSFSLWARFLGNCSSISYTNLMMDRVLTGSDGFEIELGVDDELPNEVKSWVKKHIILA